MAEQSLEQKRAKHAYGCVDPKRLKWSDAGNYASYVKSLPPTILQIGLGQTLATIKSRQGTDIGYKHLYEHLNDWLTQKCPHKDSNIGNDILTFITNTDETSYLRIQDETMAYLRWLKKFAVAFAPNEQTEDSEDAPASET